MAERIEIERIIERKLQEEYGLINWHRIAGKPDDLGGGSASREEVPLEFGSLATDASADVEFEVTGARIIWVTSSRECRFRVYGTDADRTADAARVIGTDPTGDHGLLLEVVIDSSLELRLTPTVDCHNLDDPTANELFASATNLDATGDVDVNLILLETETS